MNFPLILLLATLFTGVMWALDRRVWLPRRRAAAEAAARQFEADNREAINRGEKSVIDARAAVYSRAMLEPWWIDYTAGLFPVIAAVFLLRSFVAEPFRIPSGSMLPTLYIGDFILVNKFSYGVRLPVTNTKVIPVGEPQRGDVAVFRYPMDTSTDYIKRVVGLPGDTIEYRGKKLIINGEPVPVQPAGDWVDPDTLVTLTRSEETLGGKAHFAVVDDRFGPGLRGQPYARVGDGCKYSATGFTCKVPEGQYFMMGDNRDNSEDSRYWGFVPDSLLVGKAVFIWANFSDMSRVGRFD
ncbi:MAG: signal peptidase I [Duodenibacillus sp.]|nr:signal peptidase I [Duodenibacillus sp.]